MLGSGSSGNVAFVEAGHPSAREEAPTRLLVDAGLPRAEIEARLARIPVALERIDGVLVTHDHKDHAGSAGALGRPLWATAGTRRKCGLDAHLVRAGERFTVGAFQVLPVLLPHDAVETVGYVLEADGARVGILTDCGHDAPEVAAGYAGCDVLVLEANHDATLLQHGSYPPSLKRRVGGRLGHLSNDQAASLLKMIGKVGPMPRLVVAAHLSQANNRPLHAKRALDRVLGRQGRVIIATPERGTPIIEITDGRVRIQSDVHEQLSFTFRVAS